MSKHTPGPWEPITDKHGEVVVYEAVTRANLDICKMGGNTNDGANARLIAAAPDLLEALKGLLAVAPSKAPAAGLIVGIEEKHKAAIAGARAAIARAEGGGQ